jgi:hypothetical protein
MRERPSSRCWAVTTIAGRLNESVLSAAASVAASVVVSAIVASAAAAVAVVAAAAAAVSVRAAVSAASEASAVEKLHRHAMAAATLDAAARNTNLDIGMSPQ